MRFRCVNGICVLQRLNPKTTTKGGLILPDSAQKKSEFARVIEACPEWREDGAQRATGLKPGDVVCIAKYSGQEFEVGDGNGEISIVLVKEKDILCILDGFDADQVNATHAPSEPAIVPFSFESTPELSAATA